MSKDKNFLGKFERKIADRPGLTIAVILAVTLFMGYFASNVSMDTTEESFQPDSPVARAQDRVSENYGTQGEQVSIIFIAENNTLNRDVLLKQLDLEGGIRNSKFFKFIGETQRNHSGISSPAKIIAQGGFLNKAFTEVFKKNPNLESGPVFKKLSSITFGLSTENLKTVLNGGSLGLEIPDFDIDTELNFSPYEPEMVSRYLKNSPFENALSYLLSKDYDRELHNAGKSLLSVTLEENLSEDQSLDTQRELQDLANSLDGKNSNFDARTVGTAIVNEEINEASGRNIGLLMPAAFIVVIIILFVVYRSFSDTFLNLIALVMAIIWVYGIGYLLGFTFSPNITAVPLLMIGLGIDYGVHYTLRYREEIKKHQKIGRAAKLTGATVGLAILLTTVTTMIGFTSGAISDISAVRQFGILSSLGIASSFIVMLTFFPAAKVLLDRRRKGKGEDLTGGRGYDSNVFGSSEDGEVDWKDYGEEDCANCEVGGLKAGVVAAKKPVAVLAIVLVITGVGLYGAYELDARYNFRDFLPEGLKVTESFDILLDDFDFGQERVYFLVEGDVSSPTVFKKIGEVQRNALESRFSVESDPPESPLYLALSLANPTSSRFNENFAEVWRKEADANSDGIVDSDLTKAEVVTVYDAIYKYAPEDAKRVLSRTSKGYSGIVVRIPVNSERGESGKLVEEMKDALKPLKNQGLEKAIVTGSPIVSYQTFRSINQGQVNSVLITFIISFTILTGLYFYMRRSKLLGLVVISPLVLVIVWTLGSMYFLGIPLNPVTVTIAAIMVGLGVDYSIHLTQRFLEDTKRIEKPECALCASVGHTGSALFGSAVTTVSGFAILSFSIIPPLAQFGQVSALGILFAFLSSVLVLPTFLLVWIRKAKYD